MMKISVMVTIGLPITLWTRHKNVVLYSTMWREWCSNWESLDLAFPLHFGIYVGDGAPGIIRHTVTVHVVGGKPPLLQVHDVGTCEYHEKCLKSKGNNDVMTTCNFGGKWVATWDSFWAQELHFKYIWHVFHDEDNKVCFQ